MTQTDVALPFERYFGGGRRLLGSPAGGDGSSRRGYGVPVFRECGTRCAYCGYDMEGSYESWLNLSVDHVIPDGAARRLGYPREWVADTANLVTCCRACNEFLCHWKLSDPSPATVEEFFDLRDRHFREKRQWVLQRHQSERTWYDATNPPKAEA
jgi:hypothetical protein